MRAIVVSVWMSLDGVFDANTMEQWFNPYESEERGEYIKNNVLTSDAVLVGRVTYEMLAGYWPNLKNNEFGIADKLNSMPKYVVSSTLKEASWNNSTVLKGNLVDEVTRLKHQPSGSIIVFGSATLVQALIRAGLVDEFRFLVHPVMAGSGKRFFREGMGPSGLSLEKTQTFPNGVVYFSYTTEKI
jgi:dihydrofolate reductase